MSHVDEGALHAYLDGALDEYPAADADRVREHLEVCGTCRDRLEEERTIRDQAASILGVAAPRVDVPTLEELRSFVRARTKERSPTPSRLYRLGWAASIVVALGIGLMVGRERMAPDASSDVVDSAEQEGSGAERTASTGPASTTPDRARALASTVDTLDADLPSPPAPVRLGDAALLPSRTPLPDVDGDAMPAWERSRTADSGVVTDLGSVPPIPEAPRLEDSIVPRVLTPDLLVDASAGGRRDPVQERPSRTPPEVATSANVLAPTQGLDSFGPTLDLTAVDEAPSYEADGEASYSLVVPGLDVLDVRFRGAGVRPEGQVALQRLESGDTLTVIHLPREIELSSIEDPPPDARQIVVETSSGWIVMRAPVSEDALLDLMRRLLSAD